MYKSDISLEFYITFPPMKLRTVSGAEITNYLLKLACIKTSQYLKEYALK